MMQHNKINFLTFKDIHTHPTIRSLPNSQLDVNSLFQHTCNSFEHKIDRIQTHKISYDMRNQLRNFHIWFCWYSCELRPSPWIHVLHTPMPSTALHQTSPATPRTKSPHTPNNKIVLYPNLTLRLILRILFHNSILWYRTMQFHKDPAAKRLI